MKPVLVAFALLFVVMPVLSKDDAPAAGRLMRLEESNNQFAIRIYREFSDETGNLFLSPYSIHSALAMTMEGARGGTQRQMGEVLELGRGSGARFFLGLRDSLKPGKVVDGYGREAKYVPAYELSVANALWGQENISFLPLFTSTLREAYEAPLERIDFRQTKKARDRINAWVAERTKDRIQNIVPEDLPTPECLVALANAIYFKAAWHKPFEKEWTKEAAFLTAEGSKVAAKMMHKVGGHRYAETDAAQILEIDYRGHEASMVIVLPKEEDGLGALENELTWQGLDRMINALKDRQVSVKLPKFEFTWARNLAGKLPDMGMPDAFNARKADFTGMTKAGPLFIGAVLHKAFIAVDEAGTEAAAATVVLMDRGGRPAEPVAFVANHPFLFVIRHRKTGCILFMGRVTDPRAD